MKKLLLISCVFTGLNTYGHNGFYLQSEIGAGVSNTVWQPSTAPGTGQKNVLGYLGQLDMGIKSGRWQFEAGLGYMQTGVKLLNSHRYDFESPEFRVHGYYVVGPERITDYNPHITLPLKVGYELFGGNSKLSFIPFIGAELTYNMPRTFVQQTVATDHVYPAWKTVETKQQFDASCNSFGVIALIQLNFAYRLSSRFDLIAGPSLHFMLTSEVNFKGQHDYAALMNLGLKYNFINRKHTSENNRSIPKGVPES